MVIGTDDKLLAANVCSILIPIVISMVVQPTWSDRRRALVSVGVIAVITLLMAIWVGEGLPQTLDWRAWTRLALVNLLGAWVSYQHFYKPTGAAGYLEVLTSPPTDASRELLLETERRTRPPRTEEL